MGRSPCCDKASVKRGPWSPEEDAKLKEYMNKYGTGGNWIALPAKAGLKRCGKSCRLRWLNYLRPNIKHGEFSDEEERIICSLLASIGSRWSVIAAQLPGRTDNDIKNYWNTKLKKKLLGTTPSKRNNDSQQQHQPNQQEQQHRPIFSSSLDLLNAENPNSQLTQPINNACSTSSDPFPPDVESLPISEDLFSSYSTTDNGGSFQGNKIENGKMGLWEESLLDQFGFEDIEVWTFPTFGCNHLFLDDPIGSNNSYNF